MTAAADVPGRRVVAVSGTAAVHLSATATLIVRSLVEAAADAVGPTALTAAGVRMIVAEVVRAQPRRDWRTDVALVVAIGALILQWLSYQQDRAEYARTDPPPQRDRGRPAARLGRDRAPSGRAPP